VALGLVMIGAPARADDPAFAAWLEGVWPDARQVGVSRATFDAAAKGLAPDLSLPDLVIPGQPQRVDKGQAEFVQSPAQYLKESTLQRLATQGRKLSTEHRDTLRRIEEQFGVPGEVVLALWGRETAFGGHRLPHNALRVLATQAYLGRRKEQFRQEFVTALRMIEERRVTAADMRSSWAGAMGLTQFLPSEYYRHGVDFDGDGRIDIWRSVPDALASAAKQLVNKGWQRGSRWAYEVRPPGQLDCTMSDPDRKLPVREWLRLGFNVIGGRRPTDQELGQEASLFLPQGIYGPAFLALKNYFVIKDYNFADLYVLFVGNLSDRIAGGPAFATQWANVAQARTRDVEAMQNLLTRQGFYADKIDGKAGMKTRLALGAYQKARGLKVDCWPTAEGIAAMLGAPPTR
jgi:lytic murein transglycosylase